MRRWNGWGDDSIETSCRRAPSSCSGRWSARPPPPRDASLEDVVGGGPGLARCRRPAPRRPTRSIGSAHARGQSLPDWVALRSGRLGAVPDAVARPPDAAAVAEPLRARRADRRCADPVRRRDQRRRRRHGPAVGPAGRHRRPGARPPGCTRSTSGAASRRSGPGRVGPDLEAALEPHGLLLGHYPQSFEASTVGGWVVDPLGRPAIARLRPDRGALRRRPPRDPARTARPAGVPGLGRRTRTCARSSSARRGGSGS